MPRADFLMKGETIGVALRMIRQRGLYIAIYMSACHHVTLVRNKMAVPKNQIGFECEFVAAPVDYLQSECPICLHILREPYQVTCCGKSFCRLCIERIKDNNKPCPCCNKDSFNDFPNKGLQQPLYGFKVYCVNKGKGCEWKGELGQLDNHLNLSPQEDKELEGCEFAEIECCYCSDVTLRSKLLHHKKELCDKRPFSCEFCNEYESTYDDVFFNHWPVCGCYPVRCPNECGAFPERQKLDDHLEKECPLTVVECDFYYAGCEVKLPRRTMPDHLKDGLVAHFSLLAMSHKQQQDEIQAYQREIIALNKSYQEEIKALNKTHQEDIKALERKQEEEIKDLERKQEEESKAITGEIDKLKMQTEQLRFNMQMFPTDFAVKNPHTYSRIRNPWSSTPFYSHSQGYKLQLAFFKHSWAGSYIICCDLMRGNYDSLLKWPLKAVMKLALLNQQRQGRDHKLKIKLNYGKPLIGEAEPDECGRCVIVASLDPYLRDGHLQIRIVNIKFKF